MKPGRELDLLIAEKVMGEYHDEYLCSAVNPYSTSIASAWDVVEKIKEYEWTISQDYGPVYSVQLGDGENMFSSCFGDSVPHAICLAALAAGGVKDE